MNAKYHSQFPQIRYILYYILFQKSNLVGVRLIPDVVAEKAKKNTALSAPSVATSGFSSETTMLRTAPEWGFCARTRRNLEQVGIYGV